MHVKDRLTGFEGPSAPPLGTGEPEFPELAAMLAQFASPFQHRPACSGPVAWKDFAAVEADIARAKAAMAKAGVDGVFMTSPSPGQIARYLKNQHYKTDEEYLFALADVMAREYRAIVDAGFVLQLDCPDLAMSYALYPGISASPTTARSSRPTSRRSTTRSRTSRPSACACTSAGARRSARTTTTCRSRTSSTSCSRAGRRRCRSPAPTRATATSGRSGRTSKLPDGKIIIPGVIDSTSNFVEHPELVADRIVQYAGVVGRENVIAGVDCGFGTFAGRVQVDSKIVWMKLASLAEGARLASKQLW